MHSFRRHLTASSLSGLFAVALMVPGALAQSAPQTERLAYSLMLGGLHVGDAVVELEQDHDSYSTGLKLTARGVAKFLREFRADLSGNGSLAAQENVLVPLPATYRRAWSGAEIDSSMTMTYHPSTRATTTEERYVSKETGEELKYEDLPWNKNDRGRDRRKPVPENMRSNSLDPMAAFISARHQIMAQGATKAPVKFRIPVYDGQRRYDIVGTTDVARQVTINGQTHNVITVNTTLVPMAGFSERGEERMRESRGKILFTADDRFIPVQVMIQNELLSGVMNLTADCKDTPAACAPPQQQAAAN